MRRHIRAALLVLFALLAVPLIRVMVGSRIDRKRACYLRFLALVVAGLLSNRFGMMEVNRQIEAMEGKPCYVPGPA